MRSGSMTRVRGLGFSSIDSHTSRNKACTADELCDGLRVDSTRSILRKRIQSWLECIGPRLGSPAAALHGRSAEVNFLLDPHLVCNDLALIPGTHVEEEGGCKVARGGGCRIRENIDESMAGFELCVGFVQFRSRAG